MEVRLSKDFIDDLKGIQSSLQQKCWDVLAVLQRNDSKAMRDLSSPGWRLHQLKSSPFTSISIDMNFRLLCKQEGQTIEVFRVVKHDLADSEHINRNDGSSTPYALTNTMIEAKDVYEALIALGLSEEQVAPLKHVRDDDAFLEALEQADQDIQSIALALYETTGLTIPRSKQTVLDMDKEFTSVLQADMDEWELYLHPSQRYIVELPSTDRFSIAGAAGTGKTVCAWYRTQYLAQKGYQVGFVCPNKAVLEVSRNMLGRLMQGARADCYYLVPQSSNDLIQLVKEVDHVIIDEGQEITPKWFQDIGHALQNKSIGITLFYDLNQLGANVSRGDTKRLNYRLENWDMGVRTIPELARMTLHINYRNSKEIAEYYKQSLEPLLPDGLYTGVPLFSSGPVVEETLSSKEQLVPRIAEVIGALRRDYRDNEIGLIFHSNLRADLGVTLAQLGRFGIRTTNDVTSEKHILSTAAEQIKGHERKAIVFCTPNIEWATRKLGQAISMYVALTRARDRLVVLQSP